MSDVIGAVRSHMSLRSAKDDSSDDPLSRDFPFGDPVQKLINLRGELRRRGLGPFIKSWTCPGEESGIIVASACNPCGKSSGSDDSWGSWEHVACRTYDMTQQEAGIWGAVNRSGLVRAVRALQGQQASRCYRAMWAPRASLLRGAAGPCASDYLRSRRQVTTLHITDVGE